LLLHGINLATTRLVTTQITLNSKVDTKDLMKKCFLYSFSFGLIACVLLFFSANFITYKLLHNRVPSFIFYIIALSLPFISMSSCLNGYFTALRKNGKNAVSRIFEQFVKMIATFYLISLAMPNELEYMCIALVLGEAISEIASFFFSFCLYVIQKRHYKCKNKNVEKIDYMKSIFKITLPVSITSYIRSGLSSIKQLLIPLRLEKSGMNCNDAISTYGLINGMTMPVLMFPEVIINSFSGLLVPEFTYYYTKKDYDKISFIISKIFRITLIFSVVIMGMFLFYSSNISFLIYNNDECAMYLKVLCPLLLFMYLDSIVDNILKGLNEQLSVMKCNILDLFVSIFCIYFLLPIWGITGYIFVIFLSELLNSSISIIQLYRITHFKIDFINWIFKPFCFVVFAYILTEFVVRAPCNSGLEFILKLFVFFGFYFLFLWFNRF